MVKLVNRMTVEPGMLVRLKDGRIGRLLNTNVVAYGEVTVLVGSRGKKVRVQAEDLTALEPQEEETIGPYTIYLYRDNSAPRRWCIDAYHSKGFRTKHANGLESVAWWKSLSVCPDYDEAKKVFDNVVSYAVRIHAAELLGVEVNFVGFAIE